MFMHCAPWLIKLATQAHEHFIEVLCGARLEASCLDATCEAGAELLAQASDHNIALEQPLLDVAQAQVKPEVPARGATDHDCRKAVTVL
jgi:hypothetical protein